MTPPKESNQFQPVTDTVNGLNWMNFLVRCLAYPHELATRRPGTIGASYRNRPESAIGVLLVPWMLTLVIPPYWGSWFIGVHLAALFVLAAVHKLAPVRGDPLHSFDVGQPWFGNESRWGETVFGLLLGGALLLVCPTVGGCHLLGTVCSRVHLLMLAQRDRRIVQTMRDAQMDAAYYASRMREER